MSLFLLSILVFLLEHVFSKKFSPKLRNFLSKQLYEKLKFFTFAADLLLFIALGIRYVLSSVEPLLIFMSMNGKEILSADNVNMAIEFIDSYVPLEFTPVDLALVTVVILTYFSFMIASGVLVVYHFFLVSVQALLYRDTGQSGVEKPPEIIPRGKLFLKLCHLRN